MDNNEYDMNEFMGLQNIKNIIPTWYNINTNTYKIEFEIEHIPYEYVCSVEAIDVHDVLYNYLIIHIDEKQKLYPMIGHDDDVFAMFVKWYNIFASKLNISAVLIHHENAEMIRMYDRILSFMTTLGCMHCVNIFSVMTQLLTLDDGSYLKIIFTKKFYEGIDNYNSLINKYGKIIKYETI